MIVHSALDKNPYHRIVFGIAQHIGNIPPPAPGEPWMFALGDPGALEDVYKRAGFLNVPVHTVAIQRRFPSAADAIRNDCVEQVKRAIGGVRNAGGAKTNRAVAGQGAVGDPQRGITAVCWRLTGDPGWNLYDLSDRLRSRGWLIAAYPLPADRGDGFAKPGD